MKASDKKRTRQEQFEDRLRNLEELAALTFDMANKTRHIMTRLDNYAPAFEEYTKAMDKTIDEIDVDLTQDKDSEID